MRFLVLSLVLLFGCVSSPPIKTVSRAHPAEALVRDKIRSMFEASVTDICCHRESTDFACRATVKNGIWDAANDKHVDLVVPIDCWKEVGGYECIRVARGRDVVRCDDGS